MSTYTPNLYTQDHDHIRIFVKRQEGAKKKSHWVIGYTLEAGGSFHTVAEGDSKTLLHGAEAARKHLPQARQEYDVAHAKLVKQLKAKKVLKALDQEA